MKRIIIVIILIFSGSGYAQSHTGTWSSFKMSSDSVTIVDYLFFADSAAGYMRCTYEPHPYWTPETKFRWYRTLDGGLSWTLITFDTLIPNVSLGIGGKYPCAPSHSSVFMQGYDNDSTILRSNDNGSHWDRNNNTLDMSQFFTMFTEKNGIGIGRSNNQPIIVKTYDGGNTFSGNYHDSLFTASIAASNTNAGYHFIPQAAFSTQYHGTFDVFDAHSNGGNGLTTLVTDNGGFFWDKHHTDFPAYSNYTIIGGLQYQKDSPNLWMLPGTPFLNSSPEASRAVFYRLRPDFNINYCFSTDYGVTWGYDTSFARKSSVFYGVSPGNIWMTLHDGIEVNAPIPSYKIAHTIDFGKSWDIDVATLNNDGKYDAQAICFTDANHGWIVAVHNGMPYIFIYHPIQNSVIEHGIPATRQLPVFPVPAINQVTINLPRNDFPLQAQVYDIVGRKYSPPYKIQNNTVIIDTHDLPAGIWLAIVKHTYGTNTTRFILQK